MSQSLPEPTHAVIEEVNRNITWLIILGILTIILGVLAINAPLMTGVAVAFILGIYLIVKGVVDAVAAFRCRSWGAGIFAFLIGVLSVIVGLIMIVRPGIAVASLSLILAIYFVVEGISRIFVAIRAKPLPGWGWMLFAGIVTILLGVIILRNWSEGAWAWALGVLVGINILLAGWTTIFMALAARSGLKDVRAAVES